MIITRLIDFFHSSNPHGYNNLSAVWLSIMGTHQQPLISALERRDAASVEFILRSPGDLMYGLESGDPIDMNGHGREMLANLARRLGVLPVFDPEQPSPSNNWQAKDYARLRSDVERIVGPLEVPSGFVFRGNPPGFPSHHFFRLSEWFTVECFLGHVPKRILEIGAGIGSFALVSYKHGAQSYAIIDIPSVAVMSAFFIASALGEDKVHLYGEPDNKSAFSKWFSCYDFESADGEYDLIVNCNSFPEMSPQYQDAYMTFISRCLAPRGIFYSCNHESDLNGQMRVSAAVERNGNFSLSYRAPFIPRPGYIEEIYRKKP